LDASLQNALAALIVAIIPIAVYYLRVYVKSHFTPVQLQLASQAAAGVVSAAERQGLDLGLTGSDKYDIASTALKKFGKTVGLKLSDDEVNALVHSALDDLKANDTTNNAYYQGFIDGAKQDNPPEAPAPSALSLVPQDGDA
jgi:hypothetical protein